MQIVARPWYDNPGVIDEGWRHMGVQDKIELQKKWDKQSEDSWNGATPHKDSLKTTSVQDIYKNLTPEAVHNELASMSAGE